MDEFLSEDKKRKEKSGLRQRALDLVSGTKQVGEALNAGKKRLKTLDTYNKVMERYYNHLPPNPEDGGKNESFVANENLIKLCKEDVFATENIHSRAKKMLNYKEPSLNPSKMKEIRFRCLTTTSLVHKPEKKRSASLPTVPS